MFKSDEKRGMTSTMGHLSDQRFACTIINRGYILVT